MANSNGVFSDLFNAVGAPIQNVADGVANGAASVLSVAESGVNLCATALTATINTGMDVFKGVADAIGSLGKPATAKPAAPAAAPKSAPGANPFNPAKP
jgi:chlorosome envelope protein F